MCERARHAKTLHARHVVGSEHRPLANQDGIDPRIVRSITHGVVVEKRHGLVQVVKHLRMPLEIGVQNVFRKVKRHGHAIAIVVVGDIVAPVEQARPVLARMRFMPFVDVHHAVTPIHFHHRGDQRDHVRANVLHVGGVVYSQAVSQFHQCGGRAGFRRMDGAGDVVNRKRLADQGLRLGVIQLQAPGIGKLRQTCAVLFGLSKQRRIGDRDGDHLAPFLGMADRKTFTRGLAAASKRKYR